jgi:hypothetical protein
LACLLTVLAPAVLADTVGFPVNVPGTSVLYGVACQSATSCVAVGKNVAETGGVVVPISDGTPGTPMTVPGTGELDGVSCPGASSCEAVGENAAYTAGVVVPITGGNPGSPITVPGTRGLDGVACSGATGCEAVGANTAQTVPVVVPITNGTPGAATTVSGTSHLAGLACQSATACEAVGENAAKTAGVVVPITGGTPGSPISVPAASELLGVACQSATSCVAVGNGFAPDSRTIVPGVVVSLTNGLPGTAIRVAGTGGGLDGVACESASSCEAIGANAYFGGGPASMILGYQVVVPIAAGAPGYPITAPGFPSFLHGVACQSSTSCEAVGQNTSQTGGAVVAVSTLLVSATLSGRPMAHGVSVSAKLTCHGPGLSCAIAERLSTVETLSNGKPIAVSASAKPKRLTVIVATTTIAIKAGGRATITTKLNQAGKRLLKQFGQLPVTLTISLTQNGKQHAIAKRKLTLEPAKPK